MFDTVVTAEVRYMLKSNVAERRTYAVVPLANVEQALNELLTQYGDNLGIVYRECKAPGVEPCKGLYNGF